MPREVEYRFWGQIRLGLTIEASAAVVGVSATLGRMWFRQRGGVMVAKAADPGSRYLTCAEREEIALQRMGGAGVREIARHLGRDPGTISRELRRVKPQREAKDARPVPYRASMAQTDADNKARRPKQRKLAVCAHLREQVQQWLEKNYSPEQIAGRLRREYPDDPEMWVSHETIYQALYVQGCGGLNRELTQHLRTGRKMRKPHRRADQRRGRIPNMVNISQRPAEVEDRAVPGHWEGDLILGSTASASAIGTVVERSSGFVLLLHLPHDHSAQEVAGALATKMSELPTQLRRTLTWDQGHEMANHARIAKATNLDIYFCDPHSPWQRGTNENTNALLRQYFPKGTDLSQWGPGYLDYVAAELNNRPRKRHHWQTPAEVLDQLLSKHDQPPSVATTA